MAITNIKVSNFKSFKNLDLALAPFNVVIGANAAGKSNFSQIFKFLRDVESNKLDDAVFMYGGSSSLINRRIGVKEDLRIGVKSDKEMGWGLRGGQFIKVLETTYEFALRFGSKSNGTRIAADRLHQRFESGTLSEEKGKLFEDHFISQGEFSVHVVDGEPQVDLEPPELAERFEKAKILPPFLFFPEYQSQPSDKKRLTVQSRYLMLAPWALFAGIGVYNIDPHLAKKPFQIGGKAELEENGGNLALILRHILDDPDKKRRFHNVLQDLLPFVVEVGTQKYPEKSVLINLRENYYDDSFPAHLLSDGTISLAALIMALYFEEKEVVIIEEPERNIHPRLVSGVMELMKDASRNKQIIVTTHSPEIVKHAGLENLLLVSRDKEGFSTISRPAEKEAVKVFLENELGLDDLFIQDLLAVP
jgi:predicted ATPase